MNVTPTTHEHYDVQATETKWRKAWEEVALDTPDLAHAKRPYYNLMMFPYPSAEGLHVGNMYAFTGSDIYGRFKRMQGYDVFEPIGLDGFGIHSENFALKIGRHPMDHAVITQKNYYNQLHQIGAMFDWTRTVETYDPDYYRWTQWLFVQMFKHGLCYRGKAEVNWCPGCKTVLADEQVIDNSCERCGKIVEKRQLEQWFFKITAYAEKLLQNSITLDWAKKVRLAQQAWIGKKEGINITYPVVTKDGTPIGEVTCFTTRPDTNFGATFVVLAPEHPLVDRLLKVMGGSNQSKGALDQVNPATMGQIQAYVQEAKRKSAADRAAEGRKKTGVFTSFYAVNGLNGKKLPLYISDFVLAGFGTGAVIGVPGHDKRDFAFAMQFDIEIKRVVVGPDGDTTPISRIEQVQEEEGVMIDSDFLNGLPISQAIGRMMDHLEAKAWGKRVTTYHLRDWLISRQRYWGPPIPMVYCSSCAQRGQSWFSTKEAQSALGNPKSKSLDIGNWSLDIPAHSAGWYPVPESDLPVVLPRIDDYKPGDDGVAPLAKHKDFYNVACPACGASARRETDVSDTFLDSSWYFLRYPSVGAEADVAQVASSNSRVFQSSAIASAPSVKNSNLPKLPATESTLDIGNWSLDIPWDREVTRRWLPVHMYTGGAEHSVLHLMYSRFVWMALRDWGYLDFSAKGGPASGWEEPFSTFYAHGLVIKDGSKMSKSKGNVVNPDEYIRLYGADALRLYLMFTGPYDQGGDFRDSAMEGMSRWVQRVWRLVISNIKYQISNKKDPNGKSEHSIESSAMVKKALHRAIKKVGEDIEKRRYNTAIATLMELVNTIGESGGDIAINDLRNFLKILAPFAPYMTEELYQRLRAGMTPPKADQPLADNAQILIPNAESGKHSKTLSQYTFTRSESIHVQPWPVYDPKCLEEDTAQIAVQINGKLRDTIVVSRQSSVISQDVERAARSSQKVAKYLDGKTAKKVIFVPHRLINFVV